MFNFNNIILINAMSIMNNNRFSRRSKSSRVDNTQTCSNCKYFREDDYEYICKKLKKNEYFITDPKRQSCDDHKYK